MKDSSLSNDRQSGMPYFATRQRICLHSKKIRYICITTPLCITRDLSYRSQIVQPGVYFAKVLWANNALQWRHNGRDGVSNDRHLHCLLNRLLRHRSKKTIKLRVTGLCERNSLVTGEFPSQRGSNAEDVYIWWRHDDVIKWKHLRRYGLKGSRPTGASSPAHLRGGLAEGQNPTIGLPCRGGFYRPQQTAHGVRFRHLWTFGDAACAVVSGGIFTHQLKRRNWTRDVLNSNHETSMAWC